MKSNRSTWWIWAIVAVVLLGALGTWAWLLLSPASPSSAPLPTASVSATPTATSPAPTSTATRTATPTPTATASPTPTPTPTAAPTPTATAAPPVGSVTPFIVAAGWDAASGSLTVSANVPQIVESDGTCTITAASATTTVSGSFAATPSAAATDCGTQSLTGDFTSGDYTVTVSYSSSLSSGSTQYFETVTIP